MAKKPPSEVSIGKFDILTTYTYAQALLHGLKDDEGQPGNRQATAIRVPA